MPQRPYDERLLRQTFDVALKAREAGEHPFGSPLADKYGSVLREQLNGYKSGGGRPHSPCRETSCPVGAGESE